MKPTRESKRSILQKLVYARLITPEEALELLDKYIQDKAKHIPKHLSTTPTGPVILRQEEYKSPYNWADGDALWEAECEHVWVDTGVPGGMLFCKHCDEDAPEYVRWETKEENPCRSIDMRMKRRK